MNLTQDASGTKPQVAPPRAGVAPEHGFLALAASFGLAFVVLTPPLQVPDEIRHLVRSDMISRGRILAIPGPGGSGGYVPRSVAEMPLRLGPEIAFHPERKQDVETIRRELSVARAPEERVFQTLPSLYSPVPYLPQALAIRIADVFDAAPVVYVYLGRLLNFALWTALVFSAIRLAPAHKWVLTTIALTPMSLFIAASLSADVATNGLAFLFVAAVLRSSRPAQGPFSKRELAGLVALATLLGLTKPTYWTLVALVWLIPGARFPDRRQRLASVATVVLGSLAPLLLWSLAMTRLEVPSLWDGADPGAQLRFIFSHPLAYAATLLRSIGVLSFEWNRNFVGSLGHFDVWLPAWTYVAYPAVLLGVALVDGGPASPIDRRGRLLLVGVAALSWLVTVTMGYVGWNPVGRELLWGIQGRYFIPFAPLLLAAIHLAKERGLPRIARLGVLGFCAFVLANSLLSVYVRYYVA